MITVNVPIPGHPYDVLVGHGACTELAGMLPRSARRVAIVTQPGVPLELDVGLPFERFEIGVGEEHKSLATIESLCRGFAAMGLTRNDAIVAHGGGIVTDVGGFAAAVWHRGIPVVHVTTTLLGMVDAAIGGKTAVNLPEGKNLVGAIWQPSGVICDLDALTTLPPRQWRCGRGEMAKYHFLVGDDLLELDEPERIARCVEIKAAVVAGDEREEDQHTGGRALLNYGHTLAHALEIATHHSLEHGEAVAIGLVYAAHLARVLDRVDDAAVRHHYDVVAGAYDLDTALPGGLDPDALVALMGRDKKAVDSLTFVLDGPRGVEVVAGVDPVAARGALDRMAAWR
jgi:5-deoxy-5-amino-3-dehydroquinate synthase